MFKTPVKILLSDNCESFKIANFQFNKMTNEEKGRFLGATNIELNENYDISTITGRPEYSRIHDVNTVLSEIDMFKYVSCQFVITCEKEDVDSIKDLLLALRLFQEGEIIAPVSFNMDSHSTKFRYPMLVNEKKIYILNQSDIPEIENLYQKIVENKSEQLELVLSRFSDAINEKTKQKNAFIDLVGILESLFLPETTELFFRFSFFISYLLNKCCEYPISFKSIEEFYTIRSKFAHTGKYDKIKFQELNEKFNELKNIVRKLILFYIEKGCKVDVRQIILDDLKIPLK